MDLQALKKLDPAGFETAATAYRAVSDTAGGAKDSVENDVSAKMRTSLDGLSAQAAHWQLNDLAENFHYIQIECGLVATALRAFAADIRPPKQKLAGVLDDAAALGLTVGDDGSVGYPATGNDVRGLPAGTVRGRPGGVFGAPLRHADELNSVNPVQAQAQHVADMIYDALHEATEVDERWAPQLRKLMADDDLTVSEFDWNNVQQDADGVLTNARTYLAHLPPPPPDGGARQNATWWKHLSAQDKADYLTMYPSLIGSMDGLPSDVRDEANRTVLDETNGAYQTELDTMPPEPPKYDGRSRFPTPAWEQWNSRYGGRGKKLQSALNGMGAIQDRIDRNGENGLPEAYLLGFDPVGKGDGKVILANGNPDHADHVAVYVPGTGSSLGGIGKDLGRGTALWQESHKQAPSADISTITWFDYDAPNDVLHATRDSYASHGAQGLRDFLDGNREAHYQATDSQAHTTLIGHSYGSTLIGDAAKGTDHLAVDDVVALGSPGMQVSRATDLGLPAEHVWAAAAGGNDNIVRDGGKFVGLGGDSTIPTDPKFGGHIMQSDSHSHGEYWKYKPNGDASVSLRNQADVIVGRYDRVKLETNVFGLDKPDWETGGG